MKVFSLWICRVLLIAFSANCLLADVAWAQRRGGRRGNASQASSADLQKYLSDLQAGRVKAQLPERQPVTAQRDNVRIARVEEQQAALRQEAQQVALYEKITQEVQPDIETALQAYNNAKEVSAVARALEELHAAGADLAGAFESFEHGSYPVYRTEVNRDSVPAQLRIPFSAGGNGQEVLSWFTGERFSSGWKKTPEDQANGGASLAKLIEIADPVAYPNTHFTSKAYAVQIISGTMDAWKDLVLSPEDKQAVADELLRAQLRLLRQLGRPQLKDSEKLPAGVRASLAAARADAKFNPEDMMQSAARGWTRIALLKIHQLYEKWGLTDPLGNGYIADLDEDYLTEIAQLRSKKLKENENSFSTYTTVGTSAVLFRIASGGDVPEMVRALDDNPEKHFSKETKLTTPFASAMKNIIPQIGEEISATQDGVYAARLGNALLEMTDNEKYSVAVRFFALETLANLKKEQDMSAFRSKDQAVNPLIFTDAINSFLAKRVVDLYFPLNGAAVSMKDYGLGSEQMQELARQLVAFYAVFDPTHADAASPQGHIYAQEYNPMTGQYEATGTWFEVEDSKGRKHQMYNNDKQPLNFEKANREANAALARLVGETILWTVGFDAIAVAFRAARGLWIATPDAVRAWRAGQGMAGATAKLQQGVRLSNAIASTREAGVVVQATKLSKGAASAQTRAVSTFLQPQYEAFAVKNYNQLMKLPKQDITSLSVFFNGENMGSLSADALANLGKVGKLDTWDFIVANLQGPISSSPAGLKALQGGLFTWMNPELAAARSRLEMQGALSRTAQASDLDLWIALEPKNANGMLPYEQWEWHNVRQTEFQQIFFDDYLGAVRTGGRRVQFALTPRSPVIYDSASGLVDPFLRPQTPFEVMPVSSVRPGLRAPDAAFKPYIPNNLQDAASLFNDFWAKPELFGVKDPDVLFEFAYMRNQAKAAGTEIAFQGGWTRSAAEFLNQTGQAEVMMGQLLRSKIPFIRFQSTLAFWAGWNMADDVVYHAGYGDWLKKTVTAEEQAFIEKQAPEYSAHIKEVEEETRAQQAENPVIAKEFVSAYDEVMAKAKAQTQGAFTQAPVIMLREALSKVGVGKISFMSEQESIMLALMENSVKLGQAVIFSQYYTGMQDWFNTAAESGALPEEVLAQFRTRLDEIKDNNTLLYIEKNKQATELAEQWQITYADVALRRELDGYVSSKMLSAAQAKAFREQIDAVLHSALPTESKVQAVLRIKEQVTRAVLSYFYGVFAVNSLLDNVQSWGWDVTYFNGAIAAYRTKINRLNSQQEATEQQYADAYEALVEQVNQLLADKIGYLKQTELEDVY